MRLELVRVCGIERDDYRVPGKRRRCGFVFAQNQGVPGYSSHTSTVAKWRKRATVQDAPMGPAPVSTVLTAEEEAVAVAFRRHTLLPLDDCLYALQATIPQLSRSALHRAAGALRAWRARRMAWRMARRLGKSTSDSVRKQTA